MPHPAVRRPDPSASATTPVVVLAGGRSERFGSDKLDVSTGLLDELVEGLLPGWLPVLVGPRRPLRREAEVVWTREDPPGGGPGAGLIAGLTAARSLAPGRPVGVLPGDGPRGWRALEPLGRALGSGARAAWSRGTAGVVPVPAMLSAVGASDLLGSGTTGAGESLRFLIGRLEPVAVQVDDAALFDVDTADDLAGHRWSTPPRRQPEEPA